MSDSRTPGDTNKKSYEFVSGSIKYSLNLSENLSARDVLVQIENTRHQFAPGGQYARKEELKFIDARRIKVFTKEQREERDKYINQRREISEFNKARIEALKGLRVHESSLEREMLQAVKSSKHFGRKTNHLITERELEGIRKPVLEQAQIARNKRINKSAVKKQDFSSLQARNEAFQQLDQRGNDFKNRLNLISNLHQLERNAKKANPSNLTRLAYIGRQDRLQKKMHAAHEDCQANVDNIKKIDPQFNVAINMDLKGDKRKEYLSSLQGQVESHIVKALNHHQILNAVPVQAAQAPTAQASAPVTAPTVPAAPTAAPKAPAAQATSVPAAQATSAPAAPKAPPPPYQAKQSIPVSTTRSEAGVEWQKFSELHDKFTKLNESAVLAQRFSVDPRQSKALVDPSIYDEYSKKIVELENKHKELIGKRGLAAKQFGDLWNKYSTTRSSAAFDELEKALKSYESLVNAYPGEVEKLNQEATDCFNDAKSRVDQILEKQHQDEYAKELQALAAGHAAKCKTYQDNIESVMNNLDAKITELKGRHTNNDEIKDLESKIAKQKMGYDHAKSTGNKFGTTPAISKREYNNLYSDYQSVLDNFKDLEARCLGLENKLNAAQQQAVASAPSPPPRTMRGANDNEPSLSPPPIPPRDDEVQVRIQKITDQVELIISKLEEARDKNKKSAFGKDDKYDMTSLHAKLQNRVAHFHGYKGTLHFISYAQKNNTEKTALLEKMEGEIKSDLLALAAHEDEQVKKIGKVLNKVVDQRAQQVKQAPAQEVTSAMRVK